jgi:PadR family transcriptional regulator, regulatory protein PadR
MPTPPEDVAVTLPRNFLRPCVLLLLKESPAHGYDLLERLKAFGFPGTDPGGLYRMLRGLEQEGLVRSAWEPSIAGPQRRRYEITRTGSETLHEHAKALFTTAGLLDAFVSRYSEYVALQPSTRRPATRR